MTGIGKGPVAVSTASTPYEQQPNITAEYPRRFDVPSGSVSSRAAIASPMMPIHRLLLMDRILGR
jgi:hypothetical protein